MAHPAYVHFDLSMEQTHVYIAPVQEYESIADFAPDIIADLQRLNEGMSNFDNCVPELPLNYPSKGRGAFANAPYSCF